MCECIWHIRMGGPCWECGSREAMMHWPRCKLATEFNTIKPLGLPLEVIEAINKMKEATHE